VTLAISSTLGATPAPTVAASEATNYGSTIEVALFVAAVLFTLLVVAALFFGVFRHAHLDSDGRVPTDHDDRSAA
jgi:hypothetical protein